MSGFRHIKWSIPLFLLSSSLCIAHDDAVVDHHDYIQIDQTLTLSQLVTLTLQKFPDHKIGLALEQEAEAL